MQHIGTPIYALRRIGVRNTTQRCVACGSCIALNDVLPPPVILNGRTRRWMIRRWWIM